MFSKTIISGQLIEFLVCRHGEIDFKLNGELERYFSEKERHPGICKWLLRQFLKASQECDYLWAIICSGDTDDEVREKAYKKYLPNIIVIDGITIYYKGNLDKVIKGASYMYNLEI